MPPVECTFGVLFGVVTTDMEHGDIWEPTVHLAYISKEESFQFSTLD